MLPVGGEIVDARGPRLEKHATLHLLPEPHWCSLVCSMLTGLPTLAGPFEIDCPTTSWL